VKPTSHHPTRSLSRRTFLKSAGVGAGALSAVQGVVSRAMAGVERPNILWITSEDNSPLLGCYGDSVARTPNIDALAGQGVVFDNFIATMPQCAPARCSIISGTWPISLGRAQNMRSIWGGSLPSGFHAFPYYLRQSGYYCTNNDKTDYNININMAETWNENSSTAHYRNRPAGSPFFAVFNVYDSHESQCSWRSPQGDPNAITLPPYLPDDPVVRTEWAKYNTAITSMDAKVGQGLAELEDLGLADDTIVFYYSDHGGVLPRSKRFVYDSGIRAAMVIRFPEKYAHLAPSGPGTRCDELVSFIDLGPTVLSLGGVAIPSNFQGRAFLGSQKGPEPEYVYAFRSRSGERHDLIRAVRSRRYKYIRNFTPHIPAYMHIWYAWDNIDSYPRIEELCRAGLLSGAPARYWCEKQPEELYDLQTDPHEVTNLAQSDAYQQVLATMRQACSDWLVRARDTGFVPELALWDGHNYAAAQNDATYPIARIVELAGKVSTRDPAHVAEYVTLMDDPSLTVKYWAIQGCIELRDGAAAAKPKLEQLSTHLEPMIRLGAAHALCMLGDTARGLPVIQGIFGLANDEPGKGSKLYALEAMHDIGEPSRAIMASAATPEWLTECVKTYLQYCLDNGFPPACPGEPSTHSKAPLPAARSRYAAADRGSHETRVHDTAGRLVSTMHRQTRGGNRVGNGAYVMTTTDRSGAVAGMKRILVR
jgi:arylsulfatase A-like enzyme